MSFKKAAYQILKRMGKPLRSKEITRIALQRRLIRTKGKTPWATMNAILIMDVNLKKSRSLFVKTGPSIFSLNQAISSKKVDIHPIRVPLNEEFVKHAIIKYLSSQGWGFFKYGGLRTRGVDIRARQQRYSRFLSIETKGSSSLRQTDETGFVYSLGQIITRMKDSKSTRNYYGLGLPEFAAKIALRRLPWQAAKKLLLSVYSVNPQGEVEEYSWKELKKEQAKRK